MKPKHKVYISYAREDIARVKEVYQELSNAELTLGMSELHSQPDQEWLPKTHMAISDADTILVALSRATSEPPELMQMELNRAFILLSERSPNGFFIVPIRLEECEVPITLRKLKCVDLFKKNGLNNLINIMRETSTPVFEQPEPSAKLVHEVAVGNSVLYAGAGLSALSGYPTWEPFVKRLLKWAKEKGFIDSYLLDGLQDSIKRGDLNFVADGIRAKLKSVDPNGDLLLEFLKKEYLARTPAIPKRNELLQKVGFSAVLTTNFDNLLEKTFKQNLKGRIYTHQDTDKLLDNLAKQRFFLAKLYGKIDQPETLLISPTQYEDAIVGNKAFAEFIEVLFVSRTILFLGASLDGILAYLEGITFQGSSRPHYALVAVVGRAWRTKADRLKRRFNIEVIPFQQSKDCPEVTKFLKILIEQTRAESKNIEKISVAAGGIGSAPQHSKLRSIKLENIGPFDNLNLKFDKSWNILFGDNGVGKTSVLKAIALAMLGREAEPYAGSIIKGDKQSGKIVLNTTEHEYITEIFRKNVNEAEIKSVPGHMLIGEGLLALGFPALRTISSAPFRGVQLPDVMGRPDVGDLNPLFATEIDPRIFNIKQWILNTDYFIKIKEGRYSESWDKFFEIIGSLIKDMRFKFHSIDLVTRQVLVTTDDGVVPVQMVSQGASSLIGWISVLIQRLYDFYDSKKEPVEQNSIVLVDEIDAHMHPAWQQTIVSDLAKLFPNIQFITTSHSPFLATGREKRQVVGLKRDENRAIQVVHPDFALKGLGAAGLATSDLFGLESHLDPETAKKLDRKRKLTAKRINKKISDSESKELDRIAAEVSDLDLTSFVRDPLYAKFVAAVYAAKHDREIRDEDMTEAQAYSQDDEADDAKEIMLRLLEEEQIEKRTRRDDS